MKKIVLPVLFFFSVFSLYAVPNPKDADKVYGKYERSKMDFWKAKSDKPTPEVVFFHGGGFRQGDKGSIKHFLPMDKFLDKGVSLITVNYPFLNALILNGAGQVTRV